ncbi:Zn(II)2Cys6 transcription factor [Aspergillus melleus]|uniref:Zn(II)2Cys6 transcription factor n=1 Tax=Aspergillus melleus TaxID=138277 RepID=UPI001E8D4725|nr:uncharacterized protein LDX57_006072 [Aspergillus melleus]KAH8428371.1 hypothetical protein LDX57_006072 [Aspergillus melleus]
MACIHCQRRKRDCDERRPRCNFCRASRLRCRYEQRPALLRARREQRRVEPEETPSPTERSETVSLSERSTESPISPISPPSMQQYIHTLDPFKSYLRQESLFAKFLASWDDEFPHLKEMEDVEQTAIHFNFDEPGIQLPPPYNPMGRKPTESEIQQGIVSVTWPSELTPSPFQPPSLQGLPIRLLTQYYGRVLDGQLTYKRPDWTYYTFFFHRFNAHYRCLLSAIQSWASASLHAAGKKESLEDALQSYYDSMSMMIKGYGITANSPSTIEHRMERTANFLTCTTAEERDAMFVTYFFLALFDLMAARPRQFRGILSFIASFLKNPNFRSQMTGVQARVAYWFCILDSKACAFQRGAGAVLKALGDEQYQVSALHSSHTVLQQAFRTTRTEREQSIEHTKLLLQDLMLRLTILLHQITEAKHRLPNPELVQSIRERLNLHKQTIDMKFSAVDYEDAQCRAMFLVTSALYHGLEISLSRSLRPNDARHAASQHAISIIQISQKLETLQPEGLVLRSPSMKIWPLPLVMAVIEVEGAVHRECAIKLLASFVPIASEHHTWAKKFAETVCEREDKAESRLDWEPIMKDVNDGLVV